MEVQDRKVLERKARMQTGYPSDGLTFGHRLKALRQSKRWSQSRLAWQMKPQVSGNYISDLETGKSSPQLERIRSIAEALGVDELYMTYGYEQPADKIKDVGPATPYVEETVQDLLQENDIVPPVLTPIPSPETQDDDEPSDEPDHSLEVDPTFRVKVQRNGAGVILSFYFDQ